MSAYLGYVHVQVVEHLIEVVLVADGLSLMPAYSRCSYDEVIGRIAMCVDVVDVRHVLDVVLDESIEGSSLASMLDLGKDHWSAVYSIIIIIIRSI